MRDGKYGEQKMYLSLNLGAPLPKWGLKNCSKCMPMIHHSILITT